MTLSVAQALYEKHKVLTYPRTDSRALPEDYIDTVKRDAGDADRRREGQESREHPYAAFAAQDPQSKSG